MDKLDKYVLDAQIGYRLRLANQRHLEVFQRLMPDVTPTQFAVLARLNEVGAMSQNQLGRSVAMDAATTKGVVERLIRRGLVRTVPSETDLRRLIVSLTGEGQALVARLLLIAADISRETTARLTPREEARLLALLDKL